MGFKPLAFGLLAGDSPKEALQNAIGGTSVAGKLYMDEQKKKETAEAGTEAKAGEGMKKGGKVKGWGMARGARKAKTY